PPKKSEGTPGIIELLGLDALALLKDRSFAVLIICSLLVSIPLAFYYSFTNLFLNDINFENAAGKMTIGQFSEVIFMLLMPFMFKRLGVKNMILIGMAAWVGRYLFFGFGNTGALVGFLYAGILLHGICYDFFFVTAQIYVDNKAPKNLKNSAQGLITMVTYGAGMFIGSWVAGYSVDLFTVEGEKLWQEIWMIPASIALIVMIIFSLFFKEDTRKGSIGVEGSGI
ncbi:MAG: MFS transporter, partial [Cyclobacteriaceae bacterium]|nr:MFS transporter [Cyclobacteriaceae bacterium]